MNKIFLIGNGFDLAHNVRTRYSDFILWMHVHIVKQCIKQNYNYEDEFIKLDVQHTYQSNLLKMKLDDYFILIGNLKAFFDEIPSTFSGDKILKFQYKHEFLKDIVNESINKWVDFETYYFEKLIEIYLLFENGKNINFKFYEENVVQLNAAFDYLKTKLKEYLSSIDYDSIEKIESIISLINSEIDEKSINNSLFINFNYTPILEKYIDVGGKVILSNIHGKLNVPNNDIVFGYGDETTSYYEKLENLNYNKILDHFKKFHYIKSISYRKISNFMNQDSYKVIILGHSCGISDRQILSKIFDNDKCKEIKIYYHKFDCVKNDFFEKAQEISRHFSLKTKSRMLELVKPFSLCKPLIN